MLSLDQPLAGGAAPRDLDAEMSDLSGPGASSAALPHFEASNSATPMAADATRIGLPDVHDADPVLDAMPDTKPEEAIDDLFVELIEE